MPRLPGPEDVPSRSARGGGGIPRVPRNRTAEGAVELGQSLFQTGQVLEAAEDRLQTRNEAIEQLRLQREHRIQGAELVRSQIQQGDISSPNRVKEIGTTLEELRTQTLSKFSGRPDGRLRLEASIQQTHLGLVNQVASASVTAQQAMFESELDEARNEALASIRAGTPFNVAVSEMTNTINSLPISEAAKRQRISSDLGVISFAKVDDIIQSSALVSDPLERQERLDDAQAFIESASPNLNPNMQNALFGRLNQARSDLAKPSARILTKSENVALGFPEDTVVQRKADGSFDVVFKPAEADKRDRRIKDLQSRLIERGEEENAALDRATDIVDGNIRVEIVPQTGEAREVNEVTGEVRVVPLGTPSADLPKLPANRTLFELARSGAIAGIVPGATEAVGKTLGQIPGIPVNQDVIAARQEVVAAQNELVRALSINPRFPVAEINRIREEIKISPSVVDSERALLARMVGIDRSLRIRLETEEQAAADLSLPLDTRSAASQSAQSIKNFLRRLGVPEDIDLEKDLPPEGVPDHSTKIGTTQDGLDVWESPDGRKWVVE